MPRLPRRHFLAAAAALASGASRSSAAPGAANPGATATAPAAATGTLRRVVSTEITSMDPQRPTGQVTTDLAAEMFTGLTYYDRAGRLTPGCATSWQASPDGLAWTFRLRSGLRCAFTSTRRACCGVIHRSQGTRRARAYRSCSSR